MVCAVVRVFGIDLDPLMPLRMEIIETQQL
jgi:hypothetical protein